MANALVFLLETYLRFDQNVKALFQTLFTYLNALFSVFSIFKGKDKRLWGRAAETRNDPIYGRKPFLYGLWCRFKVFGGRER